VIPIPISTAPPDARGSGSSTQGTDSSPSCHRGRWVNERRDRRTGKARRIHDSSGEGDTVTSRPPVASLASPPTAAHLRPHPIPIPIFMTQPRGCVVPITQRAGSSPSRARGQRVKRTSPSAGQARGRGVIARGRASTGRLYGSNGIPVQKKRRMKEGAEFRRRHSDGRRSGGGTSRRAQIRWGAHGDL